LANGKPSTSPDDRRLVPEADDAGRADGVCCGEADAYWADTFEEQDGKYVAIITDDRLDAPLHRPHRDVGSAS
jgi:hypothetical protein